MLRWRDSILPHIKIATFEFSRKFLNLIYGAVKIREIVTVNYSRINVWRNNVSHDWLRQKYILIHSVGNCPLSFFSLFSSDIRKIQYLIDISSWLHSDSVPCFRGYGVVQILCSGILLHRVKGSKASVTFKIWKWKSSGNRVIMM